MVVSIIYASGETFMLGLRQRDLPATVHDQVDEARANVEALMGLVTALSGVRRSSDAVDTALRLVAEQFGWTYGSYWQVDHTDRLAFVREYGDAGPEFRAVTLSASFARGEGLSGRAWQRDELVFVADLAELTDCVRAPAAQRAGVRSGICFPLHEDGAVVATMDFFVTDTLEPSAQRLDLLRCVGVLVSQALERVKAMEGRQEAEADIVTVNRILRSVSRAETQEEALGLALDGIRAGFGWTYGSYWAIDPDEQVLRFAQESGETTAKFREVTLSTCFQRGTGISGRAWSTGELVLVNDLSLISDCPRAPLASEAGVKSGVCLPIMVDGEIAGTMDFFATWFQELTPGRADALRNTAFLLGQALERAESSRRLRQAGAELVVSVDAVETRVRAATAASTAGQEVAQDASEAISSLEESGREIGQVVKSIRAIAAQTNLLALNATIEAARAGEAGKGFAVVAGEVKDLAAQTAAATAQVDANVTAIQAQVASVTASLADVAHHIDETQSLVQGVLADQEEVRRRILE